MRLRQLGAFAAAAGLVFATTVARADDKGTDGDPGVKEADSDGGYGYSFDDDPLNAGGFGPNDAVIRVRPRAARTTLIRPRTSFVPELLRSVENL